MRNLNRNCKATALKGSGQIHSYNLQSKGICHMKRDVVSLWSLMLLCLIISCSADRSNPVLPAGGPVLEKLAGTSVDTAFSWTGSLIADPCSDELLSCIGSLRFRIQIVQNASDGWHMSSRMMSDNFVATNSRTGTSYTISESSIYSAEVRPPYPIVSTQTIRMTMKGSDGSRFHLHDRLHVTIDMNGHLHVSGGEATGVCS